MTVFLIPCSLVSDKQRLEREVNRLSELVATCEQSMSRKDTLLDNLTQGLAKQRDRTKAAQCFFNWRVELLDASREVSTMICALNYLLYNIIINHYPLEQINSSDSYFSSIVVYIAGWS